MYCKYRPNTLFSYQQRISKDVLEQLNSMNSNGSSIISDTVSTQLSIKEPASVVPTEVNVILYKRFEYTPTEQNLLPLAAFDFIIRKRRCLNLHKEQSDSSSTQVVEVENKTMDSTKKVIESDENQDEICALCLDDLLIEPSEEGSDGCQTGYKETIVGPNSDRVVYVENNYSSDSSSFKDIGPVVNQNEGRTRSSREIIYNCILKCGHRFHLECMEKYISHCNQFLKCPTCRTCSAPTPFGPSPAGVMTIEIQAPHNIEFIPGYSTSGIIKIHYQIPNGIQLPHHPCPGTAFRGSERKAYLPDSPEGRLVLKLLVKAFIKGHTFTVGTSLTTGLSDVVTWNGIHHKTSINGAYGYPDPTYLDRVTEELRSKTIVLDTNEDPLEKKYE